MHDSVEKSLLFLIALVIVSACGEPRDVQWIAAPTFEPVRQELFADPGAQPNAWADYDGDGDLDLFVGFRGAPDRLYRNDETSFTDVAADVGLASAEETRAAAWGDFDGDGDADLYVGFPATAETPNRLFRNEDGGQRFVDVAGQLGVDLTGTTRQTSWIDYDADGDLDLFVAFRDGPNRLLRNDGARFTDVTASSGIGDPRRTVGVAWFDMDQDGDLDAFVANQNGDEDGFYRNDSGSFVDVAAEMGMNSPGRSEEYGGVGPAVTDYDKDGDLDIFVANYGPDALWSNEGGGRFVEIAAGTPVAADFHSTSAAWGDFDNDGWPDLYVISYMRDEPEARDHLYWNVAGSLVDVMPQLFLERGGTHGVQWMDFDADGDLDLALANNDPLGSHPLYRNMLPEAQATRSVQVSVVDRNGVHSLAGAEVRVFATGSGELLGTRLVDTGGGYCSQNVAPVHVGLGRYTGPVDVVVTVLEGATRGEVRVDGVDPQQLEPRVLTVRVERPVRR